MSINTVPAVNHRRKVMSKTREEILEYIDDCDLEYLLVCKAKDVTDDLIEKAGREELLDFILDQGILLQDIEDMIGEETGWGTEDDDMPEPTEGLEPPKDDGSGSVRA
jgi:hypothetical protein